MRRLLPLSLGFLLITAPGWGQRPTTGGHPAAPVRAGGGFAPSARSFSPPSATHGFSPQGLAPRNFGNAPHYNWNQRQPQGRPAYSSPTGPAPFGGAFPPGERAGPSYSHDRHDHDHDHDHDGRRPYYYSSGIYAVPGWISPGLWDYSDSGYGSGYGYGENYADNGAPNAAPPAPDSAPGGMASGYGMEPQYAAPAPRPAYTAEVPTPAAPLPDQPETTLVFKDGRAPQQVQSYAVTRTTLYVLDGARRREIPLSQIDLPATQQTNRDAGVDFNVPAGAK